LYIGNWGGSSGTAWVDDVSIAEYALFNVVQREGAPFRGIALITFYLKFKFFHF
jgi:hypothetical protein